MSGDSITVSQQIQRDVVDLARAISRYSADAFDFLREGLDYTVQRKHGPAVENLRKILEWLEENNLELADLPTAYEQAELPTELAAFIDEHGGPQAVRNRLNLHVGGRDLCWGLRDLALERWGLMASAVLNQWGIRSTQDFGRMVFALVEHGVLQKQPHDRMSDFTCVFDFEEAFDRAYRIDLSRNAQAKKQME